MYIVDLFSYIYYIANILTIKYFYKKKKKIAIFHNTH